MHSLDRKPSALGYARLSYMTLVVAAISLIPFEFKTPARINITLTGGVLDIIKNIVLYLPLGFLFQLARRQAGFVSLLRALAFGVLVSTVLEACQLFLPVRNSSLIDVATNGLGALMGAAIAAYLRTRERDEPVHLLFAPEMPLMNVVYLLIPMLWLGSLSMGGEINRLGLTTVLGVFGGSVLASAHVNRTRINQKMGGPMPAMYAFGWFLIGTLPALIAFPFEVLVVAVGIGLFAQLSAWYWKRGAQSEHRFEQSTLKRVFPIFGVYLLLLSVWPSTLPLAEWSNNLDYTQLTEAQRIVFTARFIEVIAAFTLLGYMVAGMRGRKDESGLKTAGWVFGSSLTFSILTAILRDFLSGPLSFLLEVTLFTVAALYGALIYGLQLEAFRRMQAKEQSR